MNDILLMMQLSGNYDAYLTKSSRLEILRYVGAKTPEIGELETECWVLLRDAYRNLAKAYDAGCDEGYLRFWSQKWGWSFEQLGKDSIREWLIGDQIVPGNLPAHEVGQDHLPQARE